MTKTSLNELHDWAAANGASYQLDETRIRCELFLPEALPGVGPIPTAGVFLRKLTWRVESPVGVGLLIPSEDDLAGGLTIITQRREEPRTIGNKMVVGGVVILGPRRSGIDRRGVFGEKLRDWGAVEKGDSSLTVRHCWLPLGLPIQLAEMMPQPVLMLARFVQWHALNVATRPPEVDIREILDDPLAIAQHREDWTDLITGGHSTSAWMISL